MPIGVRIEAASGEAIGIIKGAADLAISQQAVTGEVKVLAMGLDGATLRAIKVDASGQVVLSAGVQLQAGDIEIGAVEIKNHDDDTRARVNPLNTDAIAATQNGLYVATFGHGYNGATWDRLRTEGAGILRTSDENVDVALSTRLADATVTDRFPAAAALADDVANPTLTKVGVFLHGFDGATWDRVRSVGSGVLTVQPTDSANAALFAAAAALADAVANPTVGKTATLGYGFNGATWDRLRTEGVGILRTSDENVDVALSTILADATFTGRFPAAAAMADAVANPTVTKVASFLLAYNGATWDRVQLSGGALFVKDAVADTAVAPGTANVGVAATAIGGAGGASRVQIIIRNTHASATLYLGYSAAITTANAPIQITPGESWVEDRFNAQMYGIVASGTVDAAFQEVTT